LGLGSFGIARLAGFENDSRQNDRTEALKEPWNEELKVAMMRAADWPARKCMWFPAPALSIFIQLSKI
jgi:hypothetical protein